MKINHFHLELNFVVGQFDVDFFIFLLINCILLTCNYLFLYSSMFLIRSIQSNVSLLLDLPLFIPTMFGTSPRNKRRNNLVHSMKTAPITQLHVHERFNMYRMKDLANMWKQPRYRHH